MLKSRSLKPFAVALLLASLSGGALAVDKPLWELGAGISALSFPDYRGADTSSLYTLPFPYLVYRGDFLRADRNGIRGIFFASERADLNVSLAASLPVNSDDNAARRGMPDLDPAVEIGPSLDLNLWRTADRRYKLDLRLPVRSALTVRNGLHDIGWVFSPRINLDIIDVPAIPGWNLGVQAGPMYGSARNHAYFYSVGSAYARPDRPAYDAKAGYAGSQFLLTLSKRYPKYWIGAFARWDSLDGATFAASPLVKTERYFAAGIGIAWVLGESAGRVEADE